MGILALSVAPGQERFVASNAISIAQAHFEGDAAWYRAIYADDAPVGFIMLSENPETAEYFLWRLMIDQRFQGLGYGRRAVALIVEHVRSRPGATRLEVSCVPGDGSPCDFYRRLGFVATGEVQQGEIVMRLDFETNTATAASNPGQASPPVISP